MKLMLYVNGTLSRRELAAGGGRKWRKQRALSRPLDLRQAAGGRRPAASWRRPLATIKRRPSRSLHVPVALERVEISAAMLPAPAIYLVPTGRLPAPPCRSAPPSSIVIGGAPRAP